MGDYITGNDFHKSFNRVHNTAMGIIIFNIVIILTVLTLIVCGCVWGCNSIRKQGLKGTLNNIWEGTNKVEQVEQVQQPKGVSISTPAVKMGK